MTIHTLRPDTQTPYLGNEALYDEWYQTNLGLTPAQVRLDHHTYNDETNEVTFLIRPTNAEVTAIALTPPPWVDATDTDKRTSDAPTSEQTAPTSEQAESEVELTKEQVTATSPKAKVAKK